MRTVMLLSIVYVGDCIINSFGGQIAAGYSQSTIDLFAVVFIIAIIMDIIDFLRGK